MVMLRIEIREAMLHLFSYCMCMDYACCSPSSSLPLLSSLIDLSVGSFQHLLQQEEVSLGLVHCNVEEGNSSHSGHAIEVDSLRRADALHGQWNLYI